MRFLIAMGSLVLAMAAEAGTNEFWFPVGEKLTYRLYWGVIPVGTCEMTSEWVDYQGKKHLSIKSIAKTNYVVAKIYPIDDYVESIVEPGSFLPVRYYQRLREGRHSRNDIVYFYHGDLTAEWEAANTNQPKKRITIEKDTRDVMSLAYFMRSKGMSVGQTEKFRVVVDDKLYDLEVTGISHEKMKVAGFDTVRCIVVEPKAKFGQIFVKKGRVELWFSEDARHVCTRMTARLSFASVKGILTDVSGPGEDVWSKR